MQIGRMDVFCFGTCYALALAVEVLRLFWPRPWLRVLGLGFGAAGLAAHSLVLAFQPLSLASQYGSLLFLAWILAVFYLYGAVHYRRLAWAVFVLPLVLGLIALAGMETPVHISENPWLARLDALRGERFWGVIHGALLLLAAVGVCVGFLASVMYLIQAHRLKAKVPPGSGLQLLSLERLEEMNRRAINLAFPLLTAGVAVGIALMLQRAEPLPEWTDPKILGAAILWLVFAILLYLRYGFRLRGRRVAFLTITAFVLLVFTLASAHTAIQGGQP
jgi:ABC-type transport system involved in cytochrome c biogenesis permease subunit